MRMKTGFKWALYYAIHLLANGAAVLLFRQYLNISWFSLFPVIYMVTFYMQVRYPFYQRRQRMMRGEEDRTIAGYAHIEKDKDGKIQAWGRRYVYKDGKSPDEDMGLVYMVAPFCLPFILFFSPLVKVLSIFFSSAGSHCICGCPDHQGQSQRRANARRERKSQARAGAEGAAAA